MWIWAPPTPGRHGCLDERHRSSQSSDALDPLGGILLVCHSIIETSENLVSRNHTQDPKYMLSLERELLLLKSNSLANSYVLSTFCAERSSHRGALRCR